MTDPMWMVHAACGHCPVPHNDPARSQRCHYGCHPDVDCQPLHAVAVSAKPEEPRGHEYRPLCPVCRRPFSGAWKSHRCDETAGAA